MKRPVGVTVVAALFIIGGVYEFLRELFIIHEEPALWETFSFKGPSTWLGLGLWLTLAIGVCFTMAGIGLWRLRKWARRLAVVLCLLVMAWLPLGLVAQYFAGALDVHVLRQEPWPLLLWMALSLMFYGLCLGYMFTGEVRRAFSA